MTAERTLNVNVHHVTRVEGHGNIVLNVAKGVIEELNLEIVESPRFFEAFLRGKGYTEVNHIASRICGICATSHTHASIAATEAAMGIEVSEQTRLLRRLAHNGEMIQSHILHVYFLVAPDLFGAGSVIPLARSHPEAVKRALRLKALGNEICRVVGGRHVHPISEVPGGFTNRISAQGLNELRKQVAAALPDVEATVEMLAALQLPKVSRPTEYLSLREPGQYSYLDGDLWSTRLGSVPRPSYRSLITESVVDQSTAKHASTGAGAYAVGALARFNINHQGLPPEARASALRLGLEHPDTNPFHNNLAQVVETVHCMYDSSEVIDRVLSLGPAVETPNVRPRAGRGVGIVEAPRGTLIHEYEYDSRGRIVEANLIIPTAQNLANMEADLRALVPQALDRPKEEIVAFMEGLVRAYDPCISCAVHLLDVEFLD